nr:hypothetical protein [Tanacetum cinerariifolium]
MDCYSLPPLTEPCPQGSRCGICRGCGLGEEVRVLLPKLIFAFPCELKASPGVPSNLDDGNTALKESAEAGSPRVVIYGYDGLPMQPVAPPSPDYVLGPEHLPSPDYIPSPEHPPSPVKIPYGPQSEYTEYLAPSDDEAPLEDQPLPIDVSPTVASPGYVADSDLDEDLKEDPEDDHADYPADGRDGDDEPSDDDDDTDDEDKEPFEDEEDDKEKEEHLALVDSSVVLPAEDIEALEANKPVPTPRSPHTIILFPHTRLCRARKTVRLESSMSASIKACIARHASLLSPSLNVPSLPLPFPSPLTTSPTDTGAPLGYRAARIRIRALLPSTSSRTDILETDVLPQKRACLTTLAPRFEVGESFAAGAARQPGPTESDLRRYRVKQEGYGITSTWDEIVDTLIEIALTTLEGVDQRVTELDTTVRDRPDHRRKAILLDREAMYACEAWTGSEDRSAAIAAHVKTLEAQVAALIAQTSSLQTQLTTKIAPKKRTTRATPATTTIPTTTVTDAQLQALIDRGVAIALAERDADRSRNGDNNNDSGTGGRRQELALMCDRMFLEESAKVKRYVDGLPDMIHRSVKASKPQSMQEAIEFATELMDKNMLTHAQRQAKHKRKFNDTSRKNQNQQ